MIRDEMYQKLFIITLVCILIVTGFMQPHPKAVQYKARQIGYDVSWPNCKAAPPHNAPFGIVGVTYGRNYTHAPCLRQQARWFTAYDAYMNTGNVEYDKSHRSTTWPTECSGDDSVCTSYNYGYGAALYALAYSDKEHIKPAMWWLDVETENTWSASVPANRAAITGMVAAINHKEPRAKVGIYAYPGQWEILTGSWRPDIPAWVATGATNKASALSACIQPSFTNKPVILTQYIDGLDRDYVCRS
jgi:hypothetical protein